MTEVSQDGPVCRQAGGAAAPGEDWIAELTATGPVRDDALRRLHDLLLRAARLQVSRMSAMRAAVGAAQVDDVINLAADEAMVAVLSKLSTFEGRSRFTTWAYKFAILQAAVELRRHAWSHREVSLEAAPPLVEPRPSPDQYAEGAEFAAAVRNAIDRVLTPHQRRIALALIVDEVPIDVLADRLGSNRNALYKTLHDARGRLRADLAGQGYPVPPTRSRGGAR
ncbi:RNA polymerase sigma factor [Geodermatophilus sabuli]|uniref:RNA polymerase sigma-70 factor, ECF subfamily n=1 Tax=Geodermatophilus sabuli TaxID=1564158 RepID=A0A285EB24_9ACTN|nr:sigma-70 family RNA polymerase sigma factor [Geodermatophilus sabuli]MBB3084404.1 RNA polymerase sigma-70 factor (ECF subfamily) [Geodermatophilus sabuli]SNX96328.1 RNA polymerase sigma-70 factor, ECF subfamily [Geodermatophilus sabuli]